eukprot:Em0018g574a
MLRLKHFRHLHSPYQRYVSGHHVKRLPDRAKAVICGGGVVGCSVAYHLAKIGIKDVILLEQGSISCGTTWHAAGLVGLMRGNSSGTKICQYGVDLYPKLEEETGLGTGWKNVGSLAVARNRDRLRVLEAHQAVGRLHNIESKIVTAEECALICPLLHVDDLVGGLWAPADGIVAPNDLANALVKGATLNGAQVFEKVAVEKVEVKNWRVSGVKTNQGSVQCEIFVNCAGQWAMELGKLSTPVVNIPLHSSEHYYIVTKPMKGVSPTMPVIRDHCGYIYAREWSGGVLAGMFEPKAKPCFKNGIPKPFEFQLFSEDWDHFQIAMDQILHRFPSISNAEIRQMINGPESFTHDMSPAIGEVPEIKNYYVAAGFNSRGIMSACGVGKILADWVTTGGPPYDISGLDVRRFGPHHVNRRFLGDRIEETLGVSYGIPWPKKELQSARRVKMSPLHLALEASGASWGEAMGWERPNWFAQSPEELVPAYSFGRPHWFDAVGRESRACRERVAIFDMSSCSKFVVEGPSAESAMQYLCANNVAGHKGSVVTTGMLNTHGGYESSCTVVRLDKNKYFVVSGASQATRDAAWISSHLPHFTTVREVTSHYSTLAVMGPESRKVLQCITPASLDNDHFPFATSKEIELGYATGVLAVRTSCVGELGWELHIPTEYALGVYEQIMEAGTKWGIRNAGWYSLDSLRLEKSQLWWGVELGTRITPCEAGLMHSVDMTKSFQGKDAVLKQQREGVNKFLAVFSVDTKGDETLVPWGHETIFESGKAAGSLSSAAYGPHLGMYVCVAAIQRSAPDGTPCVLTPELLSAGKYEVEIGGQLCSAHLLQQPGYDPKSEKLVS